MQEIILLGPITIYIPWLYIIRVRIADPHWLFLEIQALRSPKSIILQIQLFITHWVMKAAPQKHGHQGLLLQNRATSELLAYFHHRRGWSLLSSSHSPDTVAAKGGCPSSRLAIYEAPWDQLSKSQKELVDFVHNIITLRHDKSSLNCCCCSFLN